MLLPTLISTLLAAAPTTKTRDASKIDWLNDDWAGAKAKALESKKLVAVDVWATWCHTCLSMKHFVLTDRALAKVAKKHVYLALDYDQPKNAAFFDRFPIAAFPTFMVIDPATDSVVARWLGSGSPAEMGSFLGGAKRSDTDAIAEGQRALAMHDFAKARDVFARELDKPSKDSARDTRIVSGWIEAQASLDPKACATEGAKYMTRIDDTAPGLDFIATVATCAESLEDTAKKEILRAIRDRLVAAATKPNERLSIDDRSGLFEMLVAAHEALGDTEAAAKAANERLALLEEASSKQTSFDARATFDAHRLSAYIDAGRWEDAERMLVASEEAQPNDFNHPWRLATLYAKQKKVDAGLAAIDRALQRGYGARRLRLHSTKIDLLLEKKAIDDARAEVATARKELASFAKGQVRKFWVDELEKKAKSVEDAR